jgi:energy-coupling factor transporter ATP-binding protein EcfA2
MTVLELKHFAQIDDARVEFGDLTVLVGPQASGKSLLLEWLKIAIDAGEIVFALKEAGHDVKTAKNLLDLTFGEGMSAAWKDGKTVVRFDGNLVSPNSWTKGLKKKEQGSVFYIPAHRALLLAEGWPAPFLKLNADTPVVARLFSQNLYQRFSGRQAAPLFPVERILKEQYRNLIDDAVFHGGQVQLEKEGLRYKLQLAFQDGTALPFMAWTAGQREFTPLLLGLYDVLPPRKVKKRAEVDWVVIEEPEMGLHPQAIAVFMLLVLDLLWRGYKVVISTHSPLVLDVVWAIRRLGEHHAYWQLLAEAFGARATPSMHPVMEHALQSDYRVYFLEIDPRSRRATTRDISGLDPDAPDDREATWGGLTGFSSRFGEAVRSAVNEAQYA